MNTQDNTRIHEDSLGLRQETADTVRFPSAAPGKKSRRGFTGTLKQSFS